MRNEKFHASGSSTSKWISVPMTPPTLQCGAWMPRVGSDPTSVAEVTLPSGNASDATASHDMAGFARGTGAGCAAARDAWSSQATAVRVGDDMGDTVHRLRERRRRGGRLHGQQPPIAQL